MINIRNINFTENIKGNVANGHGIVPSYLNYFNI